MRVLPDNFPRHGRDHALLRWLELLFSVQDFRDDLAVRVRLAEGKVDYVLVVLELNLEDEGVVVELALLFEWRGSRCLNSSWVTGHSLEASFVGLVNTRRLKLLYILQVRVVTIRLLDPVFLVAVCASS